MEATAWLKGLEVAAGGTGTVSHAGLALLRALADTTGLTARGSSVRTARGRRISESDTSFARVTCSAPATGSGELGIPRPSSQLRSRALRRSFMGRLRSGHCPVDLAAMAYTHDQDDELAVHDLVDDPVVPDAQTVAVFVPGKPLHVGVGAAWVVAQRCQCPQDRQRCWLGDGPKLPDSPFPPPERVLHAAPLPGPSSKMAATTSDML